MHAPKLSADSAINSGKRCGEPAIRPLERQLSLALERRDLIRPHPARRSLVHQRIEALAVTHAGLVELEGGRLTDRLFVKAGDVNQERRLLRPAGEAIEREHQIEMAAAKRLHLVGQAAARSRLREPIDQGGVVAFAVEPHHDTVLAREQMGRGANDATAHGTVGGSRGVALASSRLLALRLQPAPASGAQAVPL